VISIVSNCEQAHPEKAFILATGVESGPGFCRFPGLDSTEAERPSGEARFPFPVARFLTKSLAGICINVKAMRRNQVKQSTKDEIKGSLHEAKGTVKEKAGRVINNPNLAAEGQNEKLVGKVQKKVGQVEKVFEK
jgi:uncharacterized protein YjbJ (UPF0337 family)